MQTIKQSITMDDIKNYQKLWSEFIKSSKEFFGYEKKLRKLKEK